MEQAAIWSYRLILGREPESAEVIREQAARFESYRDMRLSFLRSREFGAWTAAEMARTPGAEVLIHFPAWTGEAEPGFWRDFLGVRTRCSYLGDNYAVLSGTVEGTPGTEKHPLHDPAEWIGTLRSVMEAAATGRFVAVELGAGWAPWLVGAAAAAKSRGIKSIKLAGVEGSAQHFAFMQQHFRDNGLDPAAHLLLHAVAGNTDGTAGFPILCDPRTEWGAKADFHAAEKSDAAAFFEEVPCISIETILKQLPPVDLIHCDIQGAEYEVMKAAAATLQSRVRRVVIGTHSRQIEADLLALFGNLGWTLEAECACRIDQPAPQGLPVLSKDGYQVWSNPLYSPGSTNTNPHK
jgi:FkbM family methyltransferase